jgi:hypothetical protein
MHIKIRWVVRNSFHDPNRTLPDPERVQTAVRSPIQYPIWTSAAQRGLVELFAWGKRQLRKERSIVVLHRIDSLCARSPSPGVADVRHDILRLFVVSPL